jgi:lipoate-protein ligase A
MAVDRAVLAARAAGEAPATLRLYSWRVPTVTLGRFQSLDDVDMAYCRERGFDVVRRPTGGRGVLHDDEVTYSVAASLEDGMPRGVSASYRLLCGALAEAYRLLGVPAILTGRARGEKAAGACYLHATHADLSLGAAKLSGSAQVWDHHAVLQHGSFVRTRDALAESQVFRLGELGGKRLRSETATLESAPAGPPAAAAITSAICEAFETSLQIKLLPGVLSDTEISAAENLQESFNLAE